MFVEYVDTQLYFNIIILICLIFAVLLGLIIYEICKVYISKRRRDKCTGEERRDKYEKEIKRRKKVIHRFVASAFVILCMFSYLTVQRDKYAIQGEFAWTIDERKSGYGLSFTVVEREMPDEILWYEEMLHMEWFENQDGIYIDREILNLYEKKVIDNFSVSGERKNRIGEIIGLDSTFLERKQNFEFLVKNNHENFDSEKLWKGYEDGVEVCKVYETSENVFQTGVLAESACENAYKSQQSFESSLIYTAGMVNQFEKFLEFECRDAGGGIEISEVEICFRIEKGLYRISNYNYDDKDDKDDKVTLHCALFAYSCSQYCVEKTENDNECYLVFLKNSGLNCLNILQYISDKDLCKELCQKELSRWKSLDGRDLSVYKTEGKQLDSVIEIRERLEDYVKFCEQ